eukprot:CAMPEP_0119300440 /NCGR_PEP_ID=MMETSP1333-20130426/2381_1 /TAXON_ID=418940 /ORGANISM="Scyphosphaera apsteinii, Strain RCC1455" /LENGTH=134 /DNA_ID=CAMNT_0007302217 /DNA_START=241 /DNA_END=644 /DNA_ORIENTATION=+
MSPAPTSVSPTLCAHSRATPVKACMGVTCRKIKYATTPLPAGAAVAGAAAAAAAAVAVVVVVAAVAAGIAIAAASVASVAAVEAQAAAVVVAVVATAAVVLGCTIAPLRSRTEALQVGQLGTSHDLSHLSTHVL